MSCEGAGLRSNNFIKLTYSIRNLMEESFVYILASRRNGTLYVGLTTDIVKRIWEHKNKIILGFTAKYNVNQYIMNCIKI